VYVCGYVCVRMCEFVCACVCMCMISIYRSECLCVRVSGFDFGCVEAVMMYKILPSLGSSLHICSRACPP
jgi:hypothetical protein